MLAPAEEQWVHRLSSKKQHFHKFPHNLHQFISTDFHNPTSPPIHLHRFSQFHISTDQSIHFASCSFSQKHWHMQCTKIYFLGNFRFIWRTLGYICGSQSNFLKDFIIRSVAFFGSIYCAFYYPNKLGCFQCTFAWTPRNASNYQLLSSYWSLFLFRLLIMRHVKNLAEDICKNSFIFIEEENKCDKCANRFRIKWRENIFWRNKKMVYPIYLCTTTEEEKLSNVQMRLPHDKAEGGGNLLWNSW